MGTATWRARKFWTKAEKRARTFVCKSVAWPQRLLLRETSRDMQVSAGSPWGGREGDFTRKHNETCGLDKLLLSHQLSLSSIKMKRERGSWSQNVKLSTFSAVNLDTLVNIS